MVFQQPKIDVTNNTYRLRAHRVAPKEQAPYKSSAIICAPRARFKRFYSLRGALPRYIRFAFESYIHLDYKIPLGDPIADLYTSHQPPLNWADLAWLTMLKQPITLIRSHNNESKRAKTLRRRESWL